MLIFSASELQIPMSKAANNAQQLPSLGEGHLFFSHRNHRKGFAYRGRRHLFFSHRNHRNHRKGFVYRGRQHLFCSHRNHRNHRKSYELKNFCDFCDFCVSKTIPAFPCDQTAMRKTQESSCSSVFVRGKIVGIRRVNRRFSVASAADCRNKVNGIVERNQWNC